MKRPSRILLSSITLFAAAFSHANVLFLEPLNLALGGSDEGDVRGNVGGSCRRTVLPGKSIELLCSAPRDRELREVRAILAAGFAPDSDGRMALDQVELTYRTPRDMTGLRSRYRLDKPSWTDTETIDGKRCSIEYHARVSLQPLQSASMAFAVCAHGAVPVMRYLSSRAFDELAKRRSVDAPDKSLRAEIHHDDTAGDAVAIRDAAGNVVFRGAAGRSAAMSMEKLAWTPDSQFLVWSGLDAGGHQPWHHPVFFWSRASKTVEALEDYLPGAITEPGFSVIAPAFVEGVRQARSGDTSQSFRLNLGTLSAADRITERDRLPTGLYPK
jgi:hypothetical protein